jgi:hypothetical protein
MLTLEIHNHTLQKQLAELLNNDFNGDSDRMLEELLRLYKTRRNRLKYSGILKWEKDGLIYQKEVRSEWQ